MNVNCKRPKLTDNQQRVFDSLSNYGFWRPGCGWCCDTDSFTKKVLGQLIKKNVVELDGGAYFLTMHGLAMTVTTNTLGRETSSVISDEEEEFLQELEAELFNIIVRHRVDSTPMGMIELDSIKEKREKLIKLFGLKKTEHTGRSRDQSRESETGRRRSTRRHEVAGD